MSLSKDIEKLTYENAIQELQSIVKLLDEGQQPLDETLKLFERGQALARHCEQLLSQAQLRVQNIAAQDDAGGKDA